METPYVQAGLVEVTSAYGQEGCGQPDDSTEGRNPGESQSCTDGLVGLCMASEDEEKPGEVASVEGRHVGGPFVERLAQPVGVKLHDVGKAKARGEVGHSGPPGEQHAARVARESCVPKGFRGVGISALVLAVRFGQSPVGP